MVSLDTNKTNKIHHHFFGEGGSNANLCPERLTIFGALKLTVQINIKRKKEQISYSKFKITKKKKTRAMHTKSSEAKNKLSNNYPKTDELSELQKVSQNKKKKKQID